MISCYFIGFVGEGGAKIVTLPNGSFMSVDIGTKYFSQGSEKKYVGTCDKQGGTLHETCTIPHKR